MKNFNLYLGYLESDILIIMGEDYELVNYYMKDIRQLKEDQYYIEKIIITDENLDIIYNAKNEDKMAEPFYDMYVPNIDIRIINSDFNEFNNALEESNNIIKEFLIYLIRYLKIKRKDFILKTLMNACNIVEKFITKERYNKKFMKSFIVSHKLWNCDIIEYLNIINKYTYNEELKERFDYVLRKK